VPDAASTQLGGLDMPRPEASSAMKSAMVNPIPPAHATTAISDSGSRGQGGPSQAHAKPTLPEDAQGLAEQQARGHA